MNTDGCQTVWANVICIMGPYIFEGCEVWFGISTWSYSVKNNTCAELFGLVLPHRTYLLNHLICKDDNVEHLVWFDIAWDKELYCENSDLVTVRRITHVQNYLVWYCHKEHIYWIIDLQRRHVGTSAPPFICKYLKV